MGQVREGVAGEVVRCYALGFVRAAVQDGGRIMERVHACEAGPGVETRIGVADEGIVVVVDWRRMKRREVVEGRQRVAGLGQGGSGDRGRGVIRWVQVGSSRSAKVSSSACHCFGGRSMLRRGSQRGGDDVSWSRCSAGEETSSQPAGRQVRATATTMPGAGARARSSTQKDRDSNWLACEPEVRHSPFPTIAGLRFGVCGVQYDM